MATRYRRPLLTFYLSSPPREGKRGHDFRTLPSGHSDNALLDALIRDVRARQDMVRAVLEDEDEAEVLSFVGSMTMSAGVPAVVESIRNALGVELSELYSASSTGDAFDLLRRAAEGAGVFVLLKGNLGSHHTNIDLEAFRGFALADEVAPFIIINDQDSKAAWSFTLIHELAHIWLGETGISGEYVGRNRVERFCNQVAGNFLLPAEELEKLHLEDTESIETRISKFAVSRNISGTMLSYRLYTEQAIDRATWDRLREFFHARWRAQQEQRRERARERDGGPNFYVVRGHRVGAALLNLVGRMLGSGALTTSKAGKVLGVKPTQVANLLAGGSGSASREGVR